MKKSKKKKVSRLEPTVIGSGLVALDVVVNKSSGDEVQWYAGGTCGNVLTILSFLGWRAKPVSRLKGDLPSEWLLEDLEEWGVDTSLISTSEDGSTPVIIQNIRETADGKRSHSFSLRCPCCGAYLPNYKSILGNKASELAETVGHHQVYFFDRVSRGTLTLAKASSDLGALVVFEPSGVGDPRLFEEAWSLAHVVKYSNERLRDIADLDLRASVRDNLLLEIETLGDSGLRYRSRLKQASTRGWKSLKAIAATTVRDTAGSGDWCTAGAIHKLARGGQNGFRKVAKERLVDALRYGQALATWNCGFEGARAGMYNVTKPQFERQIRKLLSGKSIHRPVDEQAPAADDLRRVCPTCESVEFAAKSTNRSSAG